MIDCSFSWALQEKPNELKEKKKQNVFRSEFRFLFHFAWSNNLRNKSSIFTYSGLQVILVTLSATDFSLRQLRRLFSKYSHSSLFNKKKASPNVNFRKKRAKRKEVYFNNIESYAYLDLKKCLLYSFLVSIMRKLYLNEFSNQ